MKLPAFKRIYPTDQQLNQVEDNVARALAPVLGQVFMGGVYIANVKLAPGSATAINHGLDRPIQGWFATDNIADCRLWRTSGTFPDKQIYLNTSATTTVSLVVF